MNGEDLFSIIGLIDDNHIEEARTITRRYHNWRQYLAIAVAIFVACGSLWHFNNAKSPQLPLLALRENDNARGYEGIILHDIAELENGNPWHQGISLKRLPIYKNTITRDGAGVPLTGLNKQQMTNLANQLAQSLNQEIDEVIATLLSDVSVDSTDKVIMITAKTKDYSIIVEADGNRYIKFNQPLSLNGNTEAEIKDALLSISNQYQKVLQLKDYTLTIAHEYNYLGSQRSTYTLNQTHGDITKQMLNYAYNYATLDVQENQLTQINLFKSNLSQFIGDYPIIDTEAAKVLLLNGQYLSSVPEIIESDNQIARVELIYSNHPFEQYLMPYYRFYIELPEDYNPTDYNLKTYGVYYVPAIEAHYLSNMPKPTVHNID